MTKLLGLKDVIVTGVDDYGFVLLINIELYGRKQNWLMV